MKSGLGIWPRCLRHASEERCSGQVLLEKDPRADPEYAGRIILSAFLFPTKDSTIYYFNRLTLPYFQLSGHCFVEPAASLGHVTDIYF